MDAKDLEFVTGDLKLVTVGRYRDLPEAEIARSVLESAGVETYLQDEHVVGMNWNMSDAVGGVRLQVESADEQGALALLNQATPETIAFGDRGNFVQPRCPTCSSSDVSTGQYYGVIESHPSDSDVWRCNACGECWEETEA